MSARQTAESEFFLQKCKMYFNLLGAATEPHFLLISLLGGQGDLVWTCWLLLLSSVQLRGLLPSVESQQSIERMSLAPQIAQETPVCHSMKPTATLLLFFKMSQNVKKKFGALLMDCFTWKFSPRWRKTWILTVRNCCPFLIGAWH